MDRKDFVNVNGYTAPKTDALNRIELSPLTKLEPFRHQMEPLQRQQFDALKAQESMQTLLRNRFGS